MLTMTYAFLSLSIEQQRLHNLLSSAQQLLDITAANGQSLDSTSLAAVSEQFSRLDASCRISKVEMYVIPAVKKATKEADFLLAELESSNAIRRQLLDSVREWVQCALSHKPVEPKPLEMGELYSSIELYCNNLLERFAKEEKELLPLAQRVISSDEWFSMGAQFLSIDTKHKARRQAADRRASWVEPGILALPDPLMSLAIGGDMRAN